MGFFRNGVCHEDDLFVASALLIQTAPPSGQPEGLESAVHAYWDHLMRHRKSQAMAFVRPESRSHFVARQEPPFRSWELASIEPRQGGGYRVTVVADRLIQDGFYNWKVREDWFLTDDGWQVRFQDQAAKRRMIWQQHSPPQPDEGVLDVRPAALRLHFFSVSQTGTVWVRNGLSEAVEVAEIEYDRQRFELLESVERIPAGSVARIRLRYRGDESEKGLESESNLKLRNSGNGEAAYRIPITYNLISRAARGLLGLTPEAAQELKKGDQAAPRRARPPGGP